MGGGRRKDEVSVRVRSCCIWLTSVLFLTFSSRFFDEKGRSLLCKVMGCFMADDGCILRGHDSLSIDENESVPSWIEER